jgi:hypothetical protein
MPAGMVVTSTAAVDGHACHSKVAGQFAHARHSIMCQWQQEYLQKKAECFRTQQIQTTQECQLGQVDQQPIRSMH